jgi:hypothetical protein
MIISHKWDLVEVKSMIRFLSRLRNAASGIISFIKIAILGLSIIHRNDILLYVLHFARGIRSTYSPDPGGLIPVKNSSGGLLAEMVAGAIRYNPGQRWLLLAEPVGSGNVVENFVAVNHGLQVTVSDFDTVMNSSWTSMRPGIDLCRTDLELDRLQEQFDVVFTQALLEHVVDPVQVIRNIGELVAQQGLIVVQTCNSFITLHRYPIDCLRFYPDFFENLPTYLPVTCLEVKEVNGSIYAIFRKR